MVPLGCRSQKLKHIICHRRSVYMLPKDANSHLNLTLTFNVEGFNYVIFVTSETMKCFGCGAERHLIRACPKARQEAGGSGSDRPAAEAGGSGSVQPAGEAGGSGPTSEGTPPSSTKDCSTRSWWKTQSWTPPSCPT